MLRLEQLDMTYKGHVEYGAIVLDDSADLPNGALATIEISVADPAGYGKAVASLAERYGCFAGALDGLPADWSEDHDEYLREQYGA